MPTLPHINLGYEAKVALRVALLHPNAPPEDALRDDIDLRFATFLATRRMMRVVSGAYRHDECRACGKHHIHTVFDVQIGNQTVPVGEDCIHNISYIVGDGYFQTRREIAYAEAIEKEIAAGTVSKEALRRHRIRVSKGWTKPVAPRGMTRAAGRPLLDPTK